MTIGLLQSHGSGVVSYDRHAAVGVDDRVTALRGRLELESPAGRGTLIAATLPLRRGERDPA